MQNGYHQTYAAWKGDPEAFWREAANDIDWFKPPERIFSPNEGVYGRWFSGAETNTCHNCLDRHVARLPRRRDCSHLRQRNERREAPFYL